MSEENAHINSSQILDIVVHRQSLKVYFLGGTSTREMSGGGFEPDVYDVEMFFPDDEKVYAVRGILVGWYSNSDPVTVICYEDGGVKLVNEHSETTLLIVAPSVN